MYWCKIDIKEITHTISIIQLDEFLQTKPTHVTSTQIKIMNIIIISEVILPVSQYPIWDE